MFNITVYIDHEGHEYKEELTFFARPPPDPEPFRALIKDFEKVKARLENKPRLQESLLVNQAIGRLGETIALNWLNSRGIPARPCIIRSLDLETDDSYIEVKTSRDKPLKRPRKYQIAKYSKFIRDQKKHSRLLCIRLKTLRIEEQPVKKIFCNKIKKYYFSVDKISLSFPKTI